MNEENMTTIGERLERIETKLDSALSGFQDHETRLRAIEDVVAQSKGGKAVMALFGSVIGGALVAIVEYFRQK